MECLQRFVLKMKNLFSCFEPFELKFKCLKPVGEIFIGGALHILGALTNTQTSKEIMGPGFL